jgi:starvation-inducible DNA-binding protein
MSQKTLDADVIANRVKPLLNQKGHEIVLEEARSMARRAAAQGDDGTNDMIVSDVIRRNELQVWFAASHAIDTPLVHAE